MRTLWKLQCKSLRAFIKRRIKVDSGSDEQLQWGELRYFDTGKNGCPCFCPSRQKKKVWGCCSVWLLTSSPLYAEVDNTVTLCLFDWWVWLLLVYCYSWTHNVSGWICSVTLSVEGKLLFHAFKEKNDVGWLKGYNGLLYKRAFSCCKWKSQPELMGKKSSVTLWSSAIIALKNLWGDIPYEQRAVGVDIHPSPAISLEWIRCLLTSEVERESLQRTASSSL